uniref:Putative secreted protein n=1 Tax=Panstrongylus lignarius TaxID=156445 RepID=A0A224XH34_9HEMI
MEAFTLLLCIGLIGNSLGLPLPISNESESDIATIIKQEGEAVTNVTNLKPDDDCSLRSYDILGDTNHAGTDSGTNQQPQLKSANMIQETVDKVGNFTGQLATSMTDKGQVIVSYLEEEAGNIINTLETLARNVSENIPRTKDELTKTISSGIKSVVRSESGKQVGEQIKAMSDAVSIMLRQLSSALQSQLMGTMDRDPESMLKILTKIKEIRATVGHMADDVEKIAEKTQIRENIKNEVTTVINQVEAFVGEDSVQKIKAIANAVGDSVDGAVGQVKEIINDVMEDENF